MSFPVKRLRRLRSSPQMRDLVRETNLNSSDMICPIFVQEGLKTRFEINSLGIENLPITDVNDEVASIVDLKIPAIMLFGIPTTKDDVGTSAFADDGIVQKTISQIRQNFGDKIVVISDVCLCQYTSLGHCGILNGNHVDNDKSIKALADIAVSHAKSGVNMVSPSAMMDGQVKEIRTALDDEGFTNVSIIPHSTKQSSSFYSPFRDVTKCSPKFGDRKSYQVPFTNAREAISEIEADVNEGADIIMIKPALAYMDLIVEARRRFSLPIAAYNVSGEYAFVKGAAKQGWINEKDVMTEILYSIKRAGADMIVTYFAKQAAEYLQL